MALTKSKVAALEYPYGNSNRRHIVNDNGHGSVPGFGCRVYRNGRKSYVLRYTLAGRRRLITIGEHPTTSVQEAREKAAALRVQIRDGIDPLDERHARIEAAKRKRDARRTVADVAAEYMADAELKPSTVRTYRQQLKKHILPRFGKREPASITEADVRRWKSSLKATPYVFNRSAFLLGAILRKAGVPDAENPAKGGKRAAVKRYRETARRRYLSAAEVARLNDALNRLEAGAILPSTEREVSISPHAAGAIRALLLTGCRVGEILNLRHDDVDRERGVANIREHKTDASGEPKEIALTAPLLDVLDPLPRTVGNPYIFEGLKPRKPLTDLARPWRYVRELADIEDVRMHDLRHAFASVAASAGMSLHLVGGLLGHASVQSTARYAHLQSDALHDAAAQVAESIAAAMQAEPGGDVVELEKARR